MYYTYVNNTNNILQGGHQMLFNQSLSIGQKHFFFILHSRFPYSQIMAKISIFMEYIPIGRISMSKYSCFYDF